MRAFLIDSKVDPAVSWMQWYRQLIVKTLQPQHQILVMFHSDLLLSAECGQLCFMDFFKSISCTSSPIYVAEQDTEPLIPGQSYRISKPRPGPHDCGCLCFSLRKKVREICLLRAVWFLVEPAHPAAFGEFIFIQLGLRKHSFS